MRREGRQRGWVFAVDRSLVDPEGKPRRRAVLVEGAANGGFVRAPRRPTNHSKPAVGRAYKSMIGGGGAGAAGSGSGSGKGARKFKHGEVKTYYQEIDGDYDDEDAVDDELVYLDILFEAMDDMPWLRCQEECCVWSLN